jgi:hypothetical protein
MLMYLSYFPYFEEIEVEFNCVHSGPSHLSYLGLKLKSIKCDKIVRFIHPDMFRSSLIIIRGCSFLSIQVRDYCLYINTLCAVLHTSSTIIKFLVSSLQ